MKKLIGLSVLTTISYLLYTDREISLVGAWKADGRKTVHSMIEAGELNTNADVKNLVSAIGDATYIFTEKTLDISFESNPNFKEIPIPYKILEKTDNSITIHYPISPTKNNQDTYHLTADGKCIYIERKKYNDYFCK
ncbi:MAG: hypothetical protein JKY50_16250 [Oleispira sp.]|nr:hypothetical protein [Oleispira sp.]MBL4882686.1 hypothetical protein [Oleispira sp.]